MWDFDLIRDRLASYEFWVAGREGFWPVEESGEAFFEYQQTLVRDPETNAWRVDVMRIPDNRTHWICSLDRTIFRPFPDAMSHSLDGIPYLRPEAVLLHKAQHTRPKDEADFDLTEPTLSLTARAWLHRAIMQINGPQHPWVARLT